MGSSKPEGLVCLHIERPVVNQTTEFMTKIGHLARIAFGEMQITSISEETPLIEELENGERVFHGQETVEEPLSRPKVQVYSENDLALVLARKTVTDQVASRYNFAHTAHRVTATSKTKNDKKKYPHLAETTRHDVYFDRIQDMSDFLWGTELALLPKPGKETSQYVTNQVIEASQLLADLTSRTGYPSSPTVPHVPFLRLPEDVLPAQVNRFIELVDQQKLLPQRLVLGAMEARPGRRQVIFEP